MEPSTMPPAQSETMPLPKVSGEEKKLAAGAYIPLLGIMTASLNPKSTYCKFHGYQGMIYTGVLFVVFVWLMFESITGSMVFLAWVGGMAIASYKAISGEMWQMPVIGSFAQALATKKNVANVTPVAPAPAPEATDTQIENQTNQPQESMQVPKGVESTAQVTPPTPVTEPASAEVTPTAMPTPQVQTVDQPNVIPQPEANPTPTAEQNPPQVESPTPPPANPTV